ncbi:MAG: tail fiber domain-containing protein [Chitinophagaceae bacterium]
MQKNLLLLLLLITMAFTTTKAQVGVSTATPHSTLDINGSLAARYRAFSSSTTVSDSDHLLVFTGTSASTLTLPSAVSCTGRMYWIKSTSTTAAALTIATSSAQTIDGQPNWIIAATNKTLKLVSNGANWLVTAEMVPGTSAAWIPGGNTFVSTQSLGTTSNTDIPFITNGTEKMRLSTTGRLQVGGTSGGDGTAIVTRASTAVTSFTPANYSDYNGSVIQSTYPGGLTGQVLNIAATGANAGNWPSDIAFFNRTNGGTDATQKMRLYNSGRLEIGGSTGGSGTAIVTRASTAVATFSPANYSDYNGSVIQSTYPGGFTGQVLNIAATGANAGNWPSDIAFFNRTNGATNASEKMRLYNSGRLEVGGSSGGTGTAIVTRASTAASNFTPATYADYNGSVIQSTYPGGFTGQVLNLVATGANAGNWPSDIAFYNRTNGGTNATQKMRLYNNGRLEIGGTTGSSGTAIVIKSATSVASFPTATYADYNGGVIQSTYPGGFVGQILNISASGSNAGNWPSNIAFWTRINGGTNAAERMRITDDGFVGIGCTSPNYRLQVVGDIAASGGTLRAASAVISTSITACSDIRYKKNIAPISGALDNVMKLQGVTYNWKTSEYPDNYFTDKNQLGIIAQELEKIYPELVETDTKGYKTVDYSKMAPVLIEAIKEQQGRIATQQAQIDALKSDLEQIKTAIAGSKK